MLKDPYYEVRVAALNFLTKNSSANDFKEYKNQVLPMLKNATFEEKLACLRLLAKVGSADEMTFLEPLYLTSNTLIREELLELLYSFYRRKIIIAEQLKDHINRVLITSNNLRPDFKLKAIIKKIYREIE